MLSAITSSPNAAIAAAGSTRPPLNLDAQLADCENQLADSVNCASASTLEGQAQIAKISSQIEAIKRQLVQPAHAAAPAQGHEYNSHGVKPPAAGTSVDTFA